MYDDPRLPRSWFQHAATRPQSDVGYEVINEKRVSMHGDLVATLKEIFKILIVGLHMLRVVMTMADGPIIAQLTYGLNTAASVWRSLL